MKAALAPSIVLLLAGVTGCLARPRQAAPACPADAHASAAAAAVRDESRGVITASQRLARQIPEFGGAFIRGGVLHVWLVDTAAAETARPVIQHLLDRRQDPDMPVRFLKGEFTYAQMEAWNLALLPHHRSGWVGAMVDEWNNRLQIGVATAEARAHVEAVIARLCLPARGIAVVPWTLASPDE